MIKYSHIVLLIGVSLMSISAVLKGCLSFRERQILADSYIDLDVVILEKGPNGTGTIKNNKYLYVMSCRDTSLRAEFNRENFSRLINDEFYNSHKVGDTLHFNWIKRSRFFRARR